MTPPPPATPHPARRQDRRRPRRLGRTPGLLALLLALALSTAPARAAGTLPLPAQEPLATARPALEAALLRATNAARQAHGLGRLTQDEGLARAAREHAAEMARLDYFAHASPVAAHATLQDRLARFGCPYVDIAENIAMLGRHGGTEATAQTTVQDWLDSPPHRENLLNASYDRVGFGTAVDAQGRLFLVQDFAADPLRLEQAAVVASSRTVFDVRVTVRAARATQALLQLGADPPLRRALPAGATTVTLTTSASGTLPLLVGEVSHGSTYLVDASGRVDLARGAYRPDPGGPRGVLRITSVTARSRTERGAQLTLRYAPPAKGPLALFLQGTYRPQARVSPGDFELFLPSGLGPATVSVGLEDSGGTVSVLQHFHVDPSAATPALRAGAAP